MSAHGQLKWEEYVVAGFAGTGLMLGIAGAMLVGFGNEGDTSRSFLIASIGGLFIGTLFWFLLTSPWKDFDDLQTPYYTGHDHDEHHDALEAHTDHEHHNHAEATSTGSLITDEHAEALVAETEVAAIEPAIKVAPAVAVASGSQRDNLRILEGIGPKVEEALNNAGIFTFAELGSRTPAELEHLMKVEQKVRIVGSTSTWVRQAKIAASGDQSALDDLKRRIKSGYLHDNLEQIEGIGPEVQMVLHDARIRNFSDLASISVEDLKALLENAGLSTLKPDTWPKQAQFLAGGDLSGLEAYKAELQYGHEA